MLSAKDVTIGVLAALTQRQASGCGRRFQVNLLSSLQGALANQAQAFLGAGALTARMGNAHPSIAPYDILACADRSLDVACGNDSQSPSCARCVESVSSPWMSGSPPIRLECTTAASSCGSSRNDSRPIRPNGGRASSRQPACRPDGWERSRMTPPPALWHHRAWTNMGS
jgi:hypothetical protein